MKFLGKNIKEKNGKMHFHSTAKGDHYFLMETTGEYGNGCLFDFRQISQQQT
jgi:hypothetical protein